MEVSKTINNTCDFCNEKQPFLVECRNCDKGFCYSYSEKCGIHFDHINNSVYSICKNCVDGISKKIIISVDYSKLECLKKKIKLRKMVKN
jgi:hypothetical protein